MKTGKRPQAAFTMVEIALCLAIIGFALVAIIGVLPTGLNVQKENREETIINQEAAVWMDAIRNGAQGYDDLTNQVIAITNYVWSYTMTGGNPPQLDPGVDRTGPSVQPPPEVNVFTRTAWWRNGGLQNNPQFVLTNGSHIVGVLSRPKIEWTSATHFYSNYIVANIRAMSGSAVEKFPQSNPTILENAFSYRMIPEIVPYVAFDTNLIHAELDQVNNYAFDPALPDIGNLTNSEPPVPPWTGAQRTNFWDVVRDNRRVTGAAYANSHELRLTFRWPLLPNGGAGNGRQTFRVFTGGRLFQTNDPSPGVAPLPPLPPFLYFLQPSTYVQAP
jgi:type II secretory pathway pseudopilin PulG